MKPDYKNWMPKGMVLGTLAGAVGCFGMSALCGCTGLIKNKKAKAAATDALLPRKQKPRQRMPCFFQG